MSASPSPAPASSFIAVAPSSLSSVGATLTALAAEVRTQGPRSPGAGAVGDAHCHAALTTASHLVAEALAASAGSLDELAGALRAASAAYGLADLLAFTPERR